MYNSINICIYIDIKDLISVPKNISICNLFCFLQIMHNNFLLPRVTDICIFR